MIAADARTGIPEGIDTPAAERPANRTDPAAAMIITAHAYARAGLVGNPSDGYFGKTISFIIRNFKATVHLWESPHFEIVPTHGDLARFDSVNDFLRDSRLHGYYGGMRLIKAAIKRFARLLPGARHRRCTTATSPSASTPTSPAWSAWPAAAPSSSPRSARLMEFYDVEIPQAAAADARPVGREGGAGINAGLQDRVIQTYEGIVYMDFDRKLHRGPRLRQLRAAQARRSCRRCTSPTTRSGPRSATSPTATCASCSTAATRPCVGAMQKYRDLTDRGRDALMAGDWDALGRVMDENFDLRRTIMHDRPGEPADGRSRPLHRRQRQVRRQRRRDRRPLPRRPPYQQLVDALAQPPLHRHPPPDLRGH